MFVDKVDDAIINDPNMGHKLYRKQVRAQDFSKKKNISNNFIYKPDYESLEKRLRKQDRKVMVQSHKNYRSHLQDNQTLDEVFELKKEEDVVSDPGDNSNNGFAKYENHEKTVADY